MTFLQCWEGMNVDNLFYRQPFLYLLLSDLRLTPITQVNNFSFLWIAFCAEIFEEDVDYKLVGQIFSIVFSNIFRTQLHFACLDVVSTLNERRIEHDSEHCLVGKACMLKDYLDISA